MKEMMSINSQFGYNKQSARKTAASYLFNFLIITNFLQYLEAGAVPALLLRLATSFKMTPGEQGLLGGIVYLSLSFGGPIAGYLLRHYDHKLIVGLSLSINNMFTLLWALTPVDYECSAFLFIAIRFFMGLTQCVMPLFLPLWSNEYAPRNQRTTYMGRLQASVPLGVMTGYIIASLSLSLSHGSDTIFGILCWRIPILIEVILVTPFCIGIFFVPKEHIKIRIVNSSRRSFRFPTTNNFSTPTSNGKPTSLPSNNANILKTTNDDININKDTTTNNDKSDLHITVNATESDYDLSYDIEDSSRGWYLDDEEKKRLSRLRQQSCSASMFSGVSSRDVVRKSSDQLCTLDTSDDLMTMLPGIKWGTADEAGIDSDDEKIDNIITAANSNIDRDMSYKSKYYSNSSNKNSNKNKRRDYSNEAEKRASWFDTFFNKKNKEKSTVKIELPSLNILGNKNEPIVALSSSIQSDYGSLDNEKVKQINVNRISSNSKVKHSRKSNQHQYQSLRDAITDGANQKPLIYTSKSRRSSLNSSSSTGSDLPWNPSLSPSLASSFLVAPMSPTNIDISNGTSKNNNNATSSFIRTFLVGHRSRAVSVDSDDSCHGFRSMDIEKKKQSLQAIDQDINEELLVSFSSTAYSSNSSEGSDDDFEGFTPKSKQGQRASPLLTSIMALLGIPVYRYLVGAMTAIYFTVTGIQYWCTSYLHIVLDAPLPLCNILFIACAATGPTLGVFLGSYIVDTVGGYNGTRQRVIALELCCVYCMLGCLFSLPITFVKDIFVVVPLLWVVLFMGGAILPATSGLIVSIVPRRHRPLSSSLSLVVFNLFGYCLSLLLSGYLMQTLNSISYNYCDSRCSYKWGFRLILVGSNVTLIFLLLSLFASYRALSKKLANRILENGHNDIEEQE